MKLGIHAYAWCTQWTNETIDLIDRTKKLGLDFIEIPLMCLETFDARAIRSRLERVGLEAVTSTVLLGDTDSPMTTRRSAPKGWTISSGASRRRRLSGHGVSPA